MTKDNGTSRINDTVHADGERRYHNTEDGPDGFLIGAITALVAAAVLYFGVRPADNDPTHHNVQAARDQLRRMLKDPTMTVGFIEQLKDTSATQELLTDPEIRDNLRQLMNALDGPTNESLDQWLKQLREKKEVLQDTQPADWAKKALQGKGDPGSVPNRKN